MKARSVPRVKARSNATYTMGTPKGLGILGLITLGFKDEYEVKIGGTGLKGF